MTEPREPTDQLGIGATDMTDRTHPDSGRTTGGIVEMLQNRVAELEAQLESIGAGGVSGPLMGRASIAASAGSEPVAHLWQHGETGRTRVLMPDMIVDADASWRLVGPLFLGSPPSPPEGMVMVPKEPTEAMLEAVDEEVGGHCYSCSKWRASYDDCRRIWAAMIAAAPPTSSADSRKGE